MKKALRYVLVFSLLTAGSPGWSTTVAPARLQRVSGSVISSDPRVPLGKVQIRISTLPEPTFIESDLEGRFVLDLPAGPWILHATATGFAELNEDLILRPGQSARPVLRLTPVDFEAEEYVVHGNRPAPEVMKLLNAPLVREMTPFEKKVAPAVRVLGRCYIVTIIVLIALANSGVIAIPK